MTQDSHVGNHAQWPDRIPVQRYGGEGVSWSLSRLAESDQRSLKRLYDAMLHLMSTKPEDPLNAEHHTQRIRDWMASHQWNELRKDVAIVGPDTYAQFGTDPTLRKVISYRTWPEVVRQSGAAAVLKSDSLQSSKPFASTARCSSSFVMWPLIMRSTARRVPIASCSRANLGASLPPT